MNTQKLKLFYIALRLLLTLVLGLLVSYKADAVAVIPSTVTIDELPTVMVKGKDYTLKATFTNNSGSDQPIQGCGQWSGHSELQSEASLSPSYENSATITINDQVHATEFTYGAAGVNGVYMISPVTLPNGQSAYFDMKVKTSSEVNVGDTITTFIDCTFPANSAEYFLSSSVVTKVVTDAPENTTASVVTKPTTTEVGQTDNYSFQVSNNSGENLRLEYCKYSAVNTTNGSQYSALAANVGTYTVGEINYPTLENSFIENSPWTKILYPSQGDFGNYPVLPNGTNGIFNLDLVTRDLAEVHNTAGDTIAVTFYCKTIFDGGFGEAYTLTAQEFFVSIPNPCAGKTCGCGSLPACPVEDPCKGKTCGCGSLPACVVAPVDECAGKTCGCGALPACTNVVDTPVEFEQPNSETTDLSKLTTEQLKQVKNFIVDYPGKNKIEFEGSLDLSDPAIVAKLADFIKITGDGEVSIDSEKYPQFNVPARITMRNLKFNGKVKILRNGVDASKYVTDVQYDPATGILTFKVLGFSTYKVVEDTGEAIAANNPTTTDKSTSTNSNNTASTSDNSNAWLMYAGLGVLIIGLVVVVVVVVKKMSN